MLNRGLYDELSLLLQEFLDSLICDLKNNHKHCIPLPDCAISTDLNMLAFEIGDIMSEPSCIIYRTGWHLFSANNAIGDSDTVIIITERWCLVNYAGAIITSNVFVDDHAESPIFELRRDRSDSFV